MPSATSVASAGVTATIVPSATRAPTPDATQRAAPTIEPDLGGFIRDFFLAVRTGDDTKARHYLAPDLATTSSAWVCFCGGKKMTDLAGVPFRRLLSPQGKTTVMFCADDTVFLPTVLQMDAG